jgi:hypothetical protein
MGEAITIQFPGHIDEKKGVYGSYAINAME